MTDVTPDPGPDDLYTVHRVQDGALDRAELTLEQAKNECAMLNAQARLHVGMTAPIYDDQGALVRDAQPIFASMVNGEVSRYEVRSASGMVIA